MIIFCRKINFYETDLMEIVHHSNYVRYFEEARLHWCEETGVADWHGRGRKFLLAVIKVDVNHRRPLRFRDEFSVEVQARAKGAKLVFQYLLRNNKTLEVAAFGQTEHALVDDTMRPMRIFPELKKIMETQSWNETLLLNL